jgi:threonine dehydrogenase-like Zn-dependent dehydrogenase
MQGRTTAFTGQPRTLEIREFDVPEPDPGAAVIRIRQAGVCGTDLHIWRGEYYATPDSSATDEKRPMPPSGRPIGHEGMGEIHALGRGLTADALGQPLAEGDRVTWHPTFPCHACEFCLSGDLNMCIRRRIAYREAAGEAPYFLGTFADYLYLPPRQPIFKVPDVLRDEEIASLNCAMATVFQGLTSAGLRKGHSVVILGAGGLGLYATAFADGIGARDVIVVDRQPARLSLACELGATHTVDLTELPTPAARLDRILEITRGRGVDIVLDAAGAGDVVQEGVRMLLPGGTFIEVGNIARGRVESWQPVSVLNAKRIIGSAGCRPDLIPRILDFLVSNGGRRPIHKVISHSFSLADIDRAFQASEWRAGAIEVIRSVVVP